MTVNKTIDKFNAGFNYEAFWVDHLEATDIFNGKNGREVRGICPYHEDTQQSFNANTATGQYNCHGCAAHGWIFDFAQSYYDVATKDAAKKMLLDDPDFKKYWGTDGATGATKKRRPAKEKVIPDDIDPDFVSMFVGQLKPEHKQYLIEKRGLSENVIKQAEIGYNVSHRHYTIPIKGLNGNCIDIRKYDPFPKPTGKLNKQSKVILEPKMRSWGHNYGYPKWYNVGTLAYLTSKNIPIIICEGELDRLCAMSNGVTNIVTWLNGVKACPDNFVNYCPGQDFLLCFDNDAPGVEYMVATATVALAAGANSVSTVAWPADFPVKGDITDYFLGDYGPWAELKFEPVDATVKTKVLPSGHAGTSAKTKYKLPQAAQADTANANKALIADVRAELKLPRDSQIIIKNQPTIARIGNQYVATTPFAGEGNQAGGQSEILTDFVFDITQVHYTEKECIRAIICKTVQGHTSGLIYLDGPDLADFRRFKNKLKSLGNYSWMGNSNYFELVVKYEFDRALNIGHVNRFRNAGYIWDHDIWAFENCVIGGGGAPETAGIEYPMDDQGVAWHNDQGYQLLDLSSGEDAGYTWNRRHSGHLPKIQNKMSPAEAQALRERMIVDLKYTIGSFDAYLLLGFVGLTAYMPELLGKFKFPAIFLHGIRESGKNSVGSLIHSHFGLDESTCHNITKVSMSALRREIQYYSMLPLWLDEYKPGSDKDELIKSVHDRSGGSLGHTQDYETVKMMQVNATMLLTGEAAPIDSALESRLLTVFLMKNKRTSSRFGGLMAIRDKLSGIFYHFLMGKTPAKVALFKEQAEGLQSGLTDSGIDPRLASAFALVATGFMAIYDPDDINGDRAEFVEWLFAKAAAGEVEKTESMTLNNFLEDIQILAAKKSDDKVDHRYIRFNREYQEVYLWLPPISNLWRKGNFETTLDNKSLVRYLSDQDYFIWPTSGDKKYTKIARIDGKIRNCVVLDFQKLSNNLQAFFSGFDDSTYSKMESAEDRDK